MNGYYQDSLFKKGEWYYRLGILTNQVNGSTNLSIALIIQIISSLDGQHYEI